MKPRTSMRSSFFAAASLAAAFAAAGHAGLSGGVSPSGGRLPSQNDHIAMGISGVHRKPAYRRRLRNGVAVKGRSGRKGEQRARREAKAVKREAKKWKQNSIVTHIRDAKRHWSRFDLEQRQRWPQYLRQNGHHVPRWMTASLGKSAVG